MKVSVTRIAQVDSALWNDLGGDENPFVSHEFLYGLEATGCVETGTGWEPSHLVLYQDEDKRTKPAGAIPLYLKYHSWGEYVFDWAWADAYRRSGLEYYPKLLCAVPFTPVTGPRLLTRRGDPDASTVRDVLAGALVKLADDSGVSSLHVLFTTDPDNQALQRQGLLRRTGNQFHWCNSGYQDFQHYLAGFTAAKRKKIRRERRRVLESGIRMEALTGAELDRRHWDAMHRFYRMTVMNHGGAPYLNRSFFEYLAQAMPERVVMFLARKGGRYIGGSLNILGRGALYGRYWGADDYVDGLHFEACYYKPIEYCIDNGIPRFEAGAQGEHKLSRGLLPTSTYSAHWLRDRRFRHAVAEFLQAETEHFGRYNEALGQHAPFRSRS